VAGFGNRAVNFSLAYRAWQGGAGLLTIPLVAHFLASNTQGYYYTFASLVALQSFFELGMSIVISVFASHEWHKLSRGADGEIEGDPAAHSRLVSLGRFVFGYFGVAAGGFWLIAGTAGFFILSRQHEPGVNWMLPWALHATISAAALWFMPFLSLLEGCNEVARVAKFRLAQSVVSNLALWAALTAGFDLWSLPLFSAVSLAMLLGFLGVVERRFFRIFRSPPRGEKLHWKHDLLPMQWRLAIQGLFSYLSFPLFTIIVYLHAGAVEAGRMGMTLQIMSGIQSFSLVFLLARAPEFALLAAAGNRAELVARCRAAALRTALVMTAGCAFVIAALAVATSLGAPQVTRVLGMAAFVTFSAGIILTAPIQAIAIYLRAHKRELLTAVGVTGGVLYGASAWLSGIRFGSSGIATSYLLVTALVVLPLTLRVLSRHRAAA
jgi:hypothetical protein